MNEPSKSNFDAINQCKSSREMEKEQTGSIVDAVGNKQQSSLYKGVMKTPCGARYTAKIYHEQKRHSIGTYLLEADAAHSYDEAARLLKGTHWKVNFQSNSDYLEARAQELIERSIDADRTDSCEIVKMNIRLALRKISLEVSAMRSESNQQAKQQSSLYKGVTKSTCGWKYVTQIFHNQKNFRFGPYLLESDAAFVYDEAARLVKGPSWKVNFQSNIDYTNTRAREMMQRSIDVDEVESLAAVKTKVHERIKKLEHPKQQSSLYKGVTKAPGGLKYTAHIYHNKKQHSTGVYLLESDAALSYDEAARLLKVSCWKVNFQSNSDYLEARARELMERSIDANKAESFDAIKMKVRHAFRKKSFKCDIVASESNQGVYIHMMSLHVHLYHMQLTLCSSSPQTELAMKTTL